MNVLSLFDGCAMAYCALEQAGIKVNKYYASEIDKYSQQVAHKNYPKISRNLPRQNRFNNSGDALSTILHSR